MGLDFFEARNMLDYIQQWKMTYERLETVGFSSTWDDQVRCTSKFPHDVQQFWQEFPVISDSVRSSFDQWQGWRVLVDGSHEVASARCVRSAIKAASVRSSRRVLPSHPSHVNRARSRFFFFQSHELTWSKNNDPVELGIIQWLWKAWSMSLEWIINKWFPWNSRGSRIRKVWPTNCRFGSRRLTAFGVGVNRSQGNRLGTNWRIWGFP